tara:strand:- start:2 stop:247 length:246 start_codon:yes stop_codon:yes gene_type:complete
VQALEEYTAFLWDNFQYDWAIFSTPWVYWTVIPWLLYSIIFLIKWYILLVPITLPCTILSGHFLPKQKHKELDISSKICNN